MGDPSVDERGRLIREATLRADAVRRSWWFALFNVASNVLLALGPLLSGSRHLYGALNVPTMLAIVAPGDFMLVTSFILYRTKGPASRAYRAAETVENLLFFGIALATVFGTGATWPVHWIFDPFCMAFLAVSKPFARRGHVLQD